jgi:hypothetical protein
LALSDGGKQEVNVWEGVADWLEYSIGRGVGQSEKKVPLPPFSSKKQESEQSCPGREAERKRGEARRPNAMGS